ncbi:1-aminocyclopropane-1-carboxylate synthase-like protein 1 [Hyalella azteca]|uniref:1-aminocyclopropane-1-carboxylate synthase-like protein 1 n=1 Tax=Hyalella azteca TaxID=294128 RepID=A0A8B7PCQ9_HYAAZ|nr:1-aminocyclopropane-1-carboxylate synthase-like protein 1 [Hyalella azteca]
MVNLGASVNSMMKKELEQRLNAPDVLVFKPAQHQHYYDFTGSAPLRHALSAFLSRHFAQGRPVPPNQLVVMNGVTSCLNCLGFACCDAGDVGLTTTPVYGKIFTDFQERDNLDMRALHLLPKDVAGTTEDFTVTAALLESRLQELQLEGKRVRLIVLINPHNPLGNVCPSHLFLDLLKVCAR